MLELPLGLRFSHLGKNVHLVGHLFERRQYPSVALCKAVLVVFQTPFFGERHHKSIADFAEIVAGKTWEEVMRHLHVQTTVDNAQPNMPNPGQSPQPNMSSQFSRMLSRLMQRMHAITGRTLPRP